MISFEIFDPSKHYSEIYQWWVEQNWSPIPITHLPTTGIVVYSDDKMACAAWIYKTDSAFCIFDWFVANPKIRKKERSDCLNYLIDTGKTIANKMGFRSIYITTKNESLISRLEKNKFNKISQGMSSLILSSQEGGF